MNQNSKCTKCQNEVVESWRYCAWCGKPLSEIQPDTTISKQIVIYLVSFFMAPLGLGWGLRYVFSKDKTAKVVGIISILLTIVAISSTIAVTSYFLNYYSKMLDGIVGGSYGGY